MWWWRWKRKEKSEALRTLTTEGMDMNCWWKPLVSIVSSWHLSWEITGVKSSYLAHARASREAAAGIWTPGSRGRAGPVGRWLGLCSIAGNRRGIRDDAPCVSECSKEKMSQNNTRGRELCENSWTQWRICDLHQSGWFETRTWTLKDDWIFFFALNGLHKETHACARTHTLTSRRWNTSGNQQVELIRGEKETRKEFKLVK